MVAVAEQPAAQPKRSARHSTSLPIASKLKAHNLFVNRGLPRAQVAQLSGLTPDQVTQLAVKGAWVKEREARSQAISKRLDSIAEKNGDVIASAIAEECDEHSFKALERTGQALAGEYKDAAKDAQAFSATLRNLVTVSRAIRAGSADVGGANGNTQVNLFFFRPSQSPVVPRRTEGESVDVQASVVAVPALPVGEAQSPATT